MIKCQPYKIDFLTPDTCIARQIKLIEIKPMMKKRKPATGKGTVEILNNTPSAAYMKIEKCDGCEIGYLRYQEFLNQEKIMGKMKRCSNRHCLQEYPATLEYFGKNAKTKDELNYYCKACQSLSAKTSYQKKIKKDCGLTISGVTYIF